MSATANPSTNPVVSVGEELPDLVIPITRTMIVATAIASRDYQDVHHDPDLAKERGSTDIFMNILTSNGLAERFVTGWAGPSARVQRVRIRLGAPNYPGDAMTMTGRVSRMEDKGTETAPGNTLIEVEIRGENQIGVHLWGTVEVILPGGGA